MSLSISQACRVMGFTAPPVDKRTLKWRYIELAKKHHPDQSGPAASADRMASVTEAYKTLQQLLANAQQGRGTLRARQHSGDTRSNSSGQDGMHVEAASFVAPGVALSTSGWTLPWQRSRTTSSCREQERQLREDASSIFDFLRRIRAMEREEAALAERMKSELKASEGSHGFTVEHFGEVWRMQQRSAPWTRRRHSRLHLIWKYQWERLAGAPKRCWDAILYVIFGH
ncbi:chaperone protein DNAJ [Trypanosoma rangeli]|uniref:Chaperone protein DNAJ n=1 Tax=Trypanosoma rangeli TaxID=5698 RepID=A0A3R7ND09_TRYRA|nr:chaperone protein DNAJ [Trypanosoma rangeli]RNF04605.1 chaperone protein DNAJ [Trypanosoma rangeli]|eukprot:RNF04605.1 chaperone protein DNAJ [Trypanosoma rangeli]